MKVFHTVGLSFKLMATSFFPAVFARTDTTMSCKNITQKEVAALFDRWNASLATLDPAKVTKNYSEDAVLLPTVSNKPRTNHMDIQDYFAHFLQKKPIGKIDQSYIKIGCNTVSDTGIYTFKLTDDKGVAKDVQARYSFVYDIQPDGQWLIEHHHSSVMPEPSAAASAH